jgi:hypothetical protein
MLDLDPLAEARGHCPPWITPLFQMPPELFIKKG